MTPSLRAHVAVELGRHKAARKAGDHDAAWEALERAHVLSQSLLRLHLAVHVAMLRYASLLRDGREAVGQLARLALAPLGHLTGRTPSGNTGRANISAFAPMPVPEELAAILRHGGDNLPDLHTGRR